MIDRPVVVDTLVRHNGEIGLIRTRTDRWTLDRDAKPTDWYMEIGTSTGNVRIRVYHKAKQISTFDITKPDHVDVALEWINQRVKAAHVLQAAK